MPREFRIERIGQQSSRNHPPTGRHIELDEEYLDEQDRIEQRRVLRVRHTVRKMKRDQDAQR